MFTTKISDIILKNLFSDSATNESSTPSTSLASLTVGLLSALSFTCANMFLNTSHHSLFLILLISFIGFIVFFALQAIYFATLSLFSTEFQINKGPTTLFIYSGFASSIFILTLPLAMLIATVKGGLFVYLLCVLIIFVMYLKRIIAKLFIIANCRSLFEATVLFFKPIVFASVLLIIFTTLILLVLFNG